MGLDQQSTENKLIRQIQPKFNKPQGLQNMKVTPKILKAATYLRTKGCSYKRIGEILNLSTMTIYRAVNNQTKNLGTSECNQ